jgi:ribose 5-phosphate isomerase B
MKVAIGSDIMGLDLKDAIKKNLAEAGHEVLDLGQQDKAMDKPPMPFAVVAGNVAKAIQAGEAERGILVDLSGGFMSVAANKYKGVYAQSCESVYVAKMAAQMNGINVIVIGAAVVAEKMATDMVDEFLRYNWLEGFPEEMAGITKQLAGGIFASEDENFRA